MTPTQPSASAEAAQLYRKAYSNHIPGRTFDLGKAHYTVSASGAWVRDTNRKSRKALHRAVVAEMVKQAAEKKVLKALTSPRGQKKAAAAAELRAKNIRKSLRRAKALEMATKVDPSRFLHAGARKRLA